ncbi:HofO [Enterobacter sp. UNJFSC 003]|uniref:HofO family protein n=1 Tax=Enterobacter sp. UNJFSC 003 TaxID=3122077 RepID=UPI002ECDF5D9|nr:HofO [Serratia liquefaciens]
MMVERWCQCRPWQRVLCWFLSVLSLGVTAWGALLRPTHEQLAARQLLHAERTNASLWPAARKVPQQPVAPDVAVLRPFSPLDFQATGTRLVNWKPLQSGGELTLDADWQAIPAVFSALAQRAVRVTAFTLSPQGAALRLRVALEKDHAR